MRKTKFMMAHNTWDTGLESENRIFWFREFLIDTGLETSTLLLLVLTPDQYN